MLCVDLFPLFWCTDVLQTHSFRPTTTLDACHRNSTSACTTSKHTKTTGSALPSFYIVTRSSCWKKTEPTFLSKVYSEYTILKPTVTVVTTCTTKTITKTRSHSRPTATSTSSSALLGGIPATITGNQKQTASYSSVTSTPTIIITSTATPTMTSGNQDRQHSNSALSPSHTSTSSNQNSDAQSNNNQNDNNDTDNDKDNDTDNNNDGDEDNDSDGDDDEDDDDNDNGDDDDDDASIDQDTAATPTTNTGITQSTSTNPIFETTNTLDGNNNVFSNPELIAQNDNSHKALGIGLGVGIGCIAALGLAGLLIYNRRKKNKPMEENFDTSEVPATRWRPQSFMGVVSSVIAKLPRSPSQRSKASTDLLGVTAETGTASGPGAEGQHYSSPTAVISHGGDADSSRQY